MRRKLVKQGAATMMVSLPSAWVKQQRLKKGDEVEIIEQDVSVVIRGAKGNLNAIREIKISMISEEESFIRITLNNLYRMGYDRMIVRYETEKQLKAICDVVESFLMGFEISTEKREKEIVIENVIELSEEKYNMLFRRSFLLIKESMQVILADMKKGKFDNKALVKQFAQKVGQYDNFCKRIITSRKFTEEAENFYWAVYNYLKLVQYNALHLYELLEKEKKMKISKKTIRIYESLIVSFDKIYTAFFRKDREALEKEFFVTKKMLYTHVHGELRKSKGAESLVLYYLGELSRLSYGMITHMFGIRLP